MRFLLVESLVSTQGMRGRVGGPVDVAVISKGDGFIWIKRKHYFNPKLNVRYFERDRRLGEESRKEKSR